VHALESYILTPMLQRQALEIPPATLFAFQILLGVIFGVWGLALALPLIAVIKVTMEYVREDEGYCVIPGRSQRERTRNPEVAFHTSGFRARAKRRAPE
jgi:predicted PurR-regulated permease PerM